MFLDNPLTVRSIRDKDGNLLCIESDKAFVELLIRLQSIPIGSLARLAARDGREGNALARLQRSVGALREGLFCDAAEGRDKVTGKDEDVDLKELIEGKGKQAIEIVKTDEVVCENASPPYLISFNGNWENGIAFKGLGSSFEISIEYASIDRMPHFMVGILQDDTDLVEKLKNGSSTYNSKGCFLLYNADSNGFHKYPGGQHCGVKPLTTGSGRQELIMRFQNAAHPKLGFRLNGSLWTYPDNDITTYVPAAIHGKCCPAILLRANGQNKSLKITNVSDITNGVLASPHASTSLFSSHANFFVTTELEILESGCFSSAVTLLRRFGISDVAELQVERVEFGISEFYRLVDAVFRGRQDVLVEVWPARDAGADKMVEGLSDCASSIGTPYPWDH